MIGIGTNLALKPATRMVRKFAGAAFDIDFTRGAGAINCTGSIALVCNRLGAGSVRTSPSGTLEVVPEGVPRINFDSTTVQLENQLCNSNDFSQGSSWGGSGRTISYGQMSDSVGEPTLNLINTTSGSGAVAQSVSMPPGSVTPVTFSAEFAAGTAITTNIEIVFYNGGTINSVRLSYTWATGAVAPTGNSSGINGGVTPLGGGLVRLWVTGCNSGGANTQVQVVVYGAATSTGIVFAGRAQLNTGTTPLEFMKTVSAPYPKTFQALGSLHEPDRKNLTSYSERFGNSNWAKLYVSVVENCIIAPDGTLSGTKLTESIASNVHTTYLSLTKAASALMYSVSIYAKAGERNIIILGMTDGGANYAQVMVDLTPGVLPGGVGWAGFYAGSATASDVGNGWRKITLTATSTAGTTLHPFVGVALAGNVNNYTGDGKSGIYIWGCQIEQGPPTSYMAPVETFTSRSTLATYLGPDGLLKVAAPQVARKVTAPAPLLPSALCIGDANAVNGLRYSEQIDNAVWAKVSTTVASNSTTAPDTTTTADTLMETTANTQHSTHQASATTITAGATITASGHFKASGRTVGWLQISNSGFTSGLRAVFDLSAGTVTTGEFGTGKVQSATMQPVGNGWYRVTATGIIDSSTTVPSVGVFLNNGLTYAGNGVSGMHVWGMQLEQARSATPYTRTVASFASSPRYATYTPAETSKLVLEQGATNWFPLTETFNLSPWSAINSSIICNYDQAPDGTLTADRFVPHTNWAYVHCPLGTNVGVYTLSVFAKALASGDFLGLVMQPQYADRVGARFDLNAGIVVGVSQLGASTNASANIQDMGNGWYRCSVTANVPTNPGAVHYIGSSDTTQTNSDPFGSPAKRPIIVWGAQMEQNHGPSSYTPSTDTFTSRASSGTYLGTDGRPKYDAGINVARYQYNSALPSSGGKLILEGATVNALSDSNDFMAAAWSTPVPWYTRNPVFDTPSVDNTAVVTRFRATSTVAEPLALRQGGLSLAGVRVHSIWLYIPAQAGVTSWAMNTDYVDSDVGTLFTSTTFDKWVRAYSVCSLTGTRSFVDLNIYVNGSSNPTVGFYFYASCAQNEANHMTSYAPTTYSFSGRATRAMSVASNRLLGYTPNGVMRHNYVPLWQTTGGTQAPLLEVASTNLLVNTENFDNPTVWTTISSGAFYRKRDSSGPDGLLSGWTLDDQATVADGAAIQQIVTIPASVSTRYAVSFYAKKGSSDLFEVHTFFTGISVRGSMISYRWSTDALMAASSDGGGVVPIQFDRIHIGNGWYRFTFVVYDSLGTNTSLQFRVYPAGRAGGNIGSTILCFPQVEVGYCATSYIRSNDTFTGRPSPATYFDGAAIVTASSGVSRSANRHPSNPAQTGELFLEVASANLIGYSNNFGGWTASGATPATMATSATAWLMSPDGTSYAYQLSGKGSASDRAQYQAHTLTVTASTVYTFSFFIKNSNSTQSKGQVTLPNSGGTNSEVSINWASATQGSAIIRVTATGTGSAGYQSYPNGWYRVWVTFTSNASDAGTAVPWISPDGTSGSTLVTIAAWGIQLEAQCYATSLIPSSSPSTVFRSADVYTSTQGTRAADAYTPTNGTRSADIYSSTALTRGDDVATLVAGSRANDYLMANVGSYLNTVFPVPEMNLFLTPSTFEHANWSKNNCSVLANSAISPDGTLTADTLVEDSTNAQHLVSQTLGTVPLGARYKVSVYAKPAGRTRLVVTGYGEGYSMFDLTGGTVVGNGGAVCSISPADNGWYKCTALFKKTNMDGRFFFFPAQNDGNTAYLGNGVSGLHLWGAYVSALDGASNLISGPNDFSSSFSWQKTRTTALSNVALGIDGSLTADKLVEDSSASSTHYTYQYLTNLESGSAYTFTVHAKAGERTAIGMVLADSVVVMSASFDLVRGVLLGNLVGGTHSLWSTATITSVGNGWYKCSVTRVFYGMSPNAHIHLLSGGSNTYTGDGSSGVYLCEAALTTGDCRVNMTQYSEKLNLWGYPNGTITTDNTLAPNGYSSAEKFTQTGIPTAFLAQSHNFVAGVQYTFSCYVKKIDVDIMCMLAYGDTFNNNGAHCYVDFNITTLTAAPGGGSGPVDGYGVIDVGNGWRRIWMAVTAKATTSSSILPLRFRDPNAVSNVYVWGIQLEKGYGPSTYIPTSTYAEWSRTVSGAGEGTFYVECSVNFVGETIWPWVARIDNGRSSSGVGFFLNDPNGDEYAAIIRNRQDITEAVSTVTMQPSGVGVWTKLAIAFRENDVAACMNGGPVGTLPFAQMPEFFRLLIGSGDSTYNGHIRRVAYFPKRLSNMEIQTLTS